MSNFDFSTFRAVTKDSFESASKPTFQPPADNEEAVKRHDAAIVAAVADIAGHAAGVYASLAVPELLSTSVAEVNGLVAAGDAESLMKAGSILLAAAFNKIVQE